jgi:hypothetical protein
LTQLDLGLVNTSRLLEKLQNAQIKNLPANFGL